MSQEDPRTIDARTTFASCEAGGTHSAQPNQMQGPCDSNTTDPVHHRLECVALSLEDKDDIESPKAHSLFLCPSNLSALLESATSMSLGVSRVREKGDKFEKTGVLDSTDEDATLSCYSSGTGDDSVTLRGRPSPVRYVSYVVFGHRTLSILEISVPVFRGNPAKKLYIARSIVCSYYRSPMLLSLLTMYNL